MRKKQRVPILKTFQNCETNNVMKVFKEFLLGSVIVIPFFILVGTYPKFFTVMVALIGISICCWLVGESILNKSRIADFGSRGKELKSLKR